MSISTRIEAIEQHLTDDYNVLEIAGADLTNVNKNILNLKSTWQERLLYFMNNGTDVVWNNWDKVIGEGTTLTLNNTLDGKMKIVLKGNTSQEGTPTPETPQDIHVVGGDNTINVMGKNMADTNDRSIGYFNSNGSINGYYGNNSTHFNKYMLIGSNNYATVSFKAKKTLTIGRFTTYVYDENHNPIASGGAFVWGDVTINAGETKVISHTIVGSPSITNAKYFRMAIYAVKDENNQALAINTKFDEYIDNFQIEMGNVANPIYTPYQSQSYSINLGDIELCKIGDYQDSIVKDNGKWYFKKEIGKLDNDIVIISYNSTYKYYTITPNITGAGAKTYSSTLSTHFQKTGPLRIVGSNSTNLWLWDENNYFQNATEIKQFMINNNVKTYYILNTPTYTEITDSTLLSQLEALKKARSNDGQTNITQTNNDLPFIINATALKEMA